MRRSAVDRGVSTCVSVCSGGQTHAWPDETQSTLTKPRRSPSLSPGRPLRITRPAPHLQLMSLLTLRPSLPPALPTLTMHRPLCIATRADLRPVRTWTCARECHPWEHTDQLRPHPCQSTQPADSRWTPTATRLLRSRIFSRRMAAHAQSSGALRPARRSLQSLLMLIGCSFLSCGNSVVRQLQPRVASACWTAGMRMCCVPSEDSLRTHLPLHTMPDTHSFLALASAPLSLSHASLCHPLVLEPH